jgi:predicted aspartyl protease
MIIGAVNTDYEAVIRLFVQGPTGPAHEIDTIIDTGFNGFLTLPPALVAALGLMRRSRGRALLANGSEERTAWSSTPYRPRGSGRPELAHLSRLWCCR